MLTFVYGGSRAGKSTWAERRVASLPNREKLFIATMRPDPEFTESVARQKLERTAEGFTATLEVPFDLESAAEIVPAGSAVILECLCNLTANELFDESGLPREPGSVIRRVTGGIKKLAAKCSLYAVSNEVAADGGEQDELTSLYMSTLARINLECAAAADEMYEVVCGIAVKIK